MTKRDCLTSQLKHIFLKHIFQLEETVSCAMGQNSLTPLGSHKLNFQLTHDQVVILEATANMWATRLQANYFLQFFSIFELGGITKHLNDWSLGKQWVLSDLDLNVPLGFTLVNFQGLGKQNSLFPKGQSLSVYQLDDSLVSNDVSLKIAHKGRLSEDSHGKKQLSNWMIQNNYCCPGYYYQVVGHTKCQ